MKNKFLAMAALAGLAFSATSGAESFGRFGESAFKTHGGHGVPSKSGRSPKHIRANRKKNKAAGKARRQNRK